MSQSNKSSLDESIAALEREKLLVKERIEELMAEIAAESGVNALKRRRYDVGYAPNDWSDEDN